MIRRTPKYTGPERRRTKRWRPRPVRVLLSLLAVIVIAYGCAVLWLMHRESMLVLEAGRTLGPARPEFTYQQVDLPRATGARQFAWIIPQPDAERPWVVFLHGSASTIASHVSLAHYRALRRAGVHVLAPEYRGFGGLGGTTTETTLEEDARAAYDYLRVTRRVPPARIAIYGWSLGSAVAIDVAVHAEIAALLLEAAPSTHLGVSEQRYPFFPIGLLMRGRFDSIGKIDAVRAPILFLHSPEDAVIPIEEGRRLYAAVRGEKTFVEIPGGHLNGADADESRFADSVRTFLKQHGILPGGGTP